MVYRPEFSMFIVNGDVKFNETDSLYNQKEKIIAESDLSVKNQIVLEIETPRDQSQNSRVDEE